jgi:hypothetical protein
MKRSTFFVGILLAAACGGSSYYIIKNPATGQSYYTTEYKTLDNGAVQLTDAKTQSTVTLPTSSIQKVDKSEYDAKLNAPAPTAAPAMGGGPPAEPAATPTAK